MKRIDTNLANSQDFFLHDWSFLQEILNDVISMQFGLLPQPCVIFGCDTIYDDFDGGVITAGAIWYNNALVKVPQKIFVAGTFTSTKEILLSFATTVIAPSPITMDGVVRSPHKEDYFNAVADLKANLPFALEPELLPRYKGVVAEFAQESWTVVGVSPAPAYQTGFSTPSVGTPLRYRKLGPNIIEIDGVFTAIGTSSVMGKSKVFALPVGYSPSAIKVFLAANSVNQNNSNILEINAAGEVFSVRDITTQNVSVNQAKFYKI